MFLSVKSLVLIMTVTSALVDFSRSAPVKNRFLTTKELEEVIVRYLDEYYEKHIGQAQPTDRSFRGRNDSSRKKVDIYDVMQGDQPVEDGNNVENRQQPSNSTGNLTDINALQASRNRTKDNWIQLLKMNILQQVGRVNSSGANMMFNKTSPLNLTQFFPMNEQSNPLEEFISKKIRTFYPSCSAPEGVTQEFKAEEKMMNLYFNYTQDDQTNQIAEATLRLHALILKNSTHLENVNCTHRREEEEKVYRISAYYYVKNQKNKRKTKKRLCDSRVIAETSRYVELNMANAVRAWNKEQNLGLAVEVEDQDGKSMKTEKYFMGPSCSVGISTPKPIPNILLDNAEASEQFLRILGRNTTSPPAGTLLLLPTLEVCTLGSPVGGPKGSKLRTKECNLRQLQDQAQKVLEKDKLERLATLTSELRPTASATHRHLRHQRNYLEEKLAESDTKILMTKEQVFELLQSLNLTNIRT
ncbi:uncharacterized protein LOC123319904 isoform X2 [Coccinella septempunctata]|uniref:uncharacterized protein LOC123319904 isoform X2 n=1 Tax=Coccinella septempunctata TaxID=41139 RepID=UPI001D08A9F1|nr:uncharacterized protein LOC123319904 isoform X2 [Coccinella septempunctata]